jgi:hypothetical protein
LYKGGAPVGEVKTGTGGVLTFTDTPTATGAFAYTVWRVGVTGAQCEVQVSEVRTLTVNSELTNPTGVNNARCGSGTVTISASSSGAVIDWYAASSGGSALRSGNNSYTTSSISTSTTYYAQARNSTTGCLSASRTAVLATVNALPDSPAGVNGARVGAGTVTISASLSGAEIDWYADVSGGTRLHTGNSYTIDISTSTTYYAQARTAAGCLSVSRTAVEATILTIPDNPVGIDAESCMSGTVTISAWSDGAEIDWYADATGGTSLHTGNSYTIAISTSTTYYAEARYAASGDVSASRTPVVAKMLISLLGDVPYIDDNGKLTNEYDGGPLKHGVIVNTVMRPIHYVPTELGCHPISGSYPPGVSGSVAWVDSLGYFVYTLAGTPTVPGIYTYTLACGQYECSRTPATITVYEHDFTPPDAISTTVWQIGDQQWSDLIYTTSDVCLKAGQCPYSGDQPLYGTWSSYYGGVEYTWYYYTKRCVRKARYDLCPGPWRVPTLSDAYALQANIATADLPASWFYGGFCAETSLTRTVLWTQNSFSEDTNDSFFLCGVGCAPGGIPYVEIGYGGSFGYQVRCVR